MSTTPKTMLVTGASRGIGAHIARQAGLAGYSVVVNYHRNQAAAEAVAQDIRQAGARALTLQADAGDDAQVRRMFKQIDSELGGLDVLVNNAGILASNAIEATEDDALSAMFRANVFSMFFCAREAVQRMSRKHGGRGGVIVNLSSAAARHGGLPGGSAYSATKGAIDSFTVALAREVGGQGIRVNALRPGVIDTEIHQVHGGSEAVRQMGATVPLGRAGTPAEVADAVMWLVSDTSSYVHGAVIDVSGGR